MVATVSIHVNDLLRQIQTLPKVRNAAPSVFSCCLCAPDVGHPYTGAGKNSPRSLKSLDAIGAYADLGLLRAEAELQHYQICNVHYMKVRNFRGPRQTPILDTEVTAVCISCDDERTTSWHALTSTVANAGTSDNKRDQLKAYAQLAVSSKYFNPSCCKLCYDNAYNTNGTLAGMLRLRVNVAV